MRFSDFALSSWKGQLGSWLAGQKLLGPVLRRALGEVTASVFADHAAAKVFSLLIRSAETQANPSGDAMLKRAEMQVVSVAVGAQFYCQTGFRGLGKTVGGAVKTAVRSLARITRKEREHSAEEQHRSSASPGSFLEKDASRKLTGRGSLFSEPVAQMITKREYYHSFLAVSLSPASHYTATLSSLVASTSGMKLKSALKAFDKIGTTNEFKGSSFIRRSWWKIMVNILQRLRAREQAGLLLVALLSMTYFAISFTFYIVGGMAVAAIAAFCVLVVVLKMLDLLRSNVPVQAPITARHR